MTPWHAEYEQALRKHLPEAGDDPLTPESRLADLGLDSFGTVELLVELEETFGVLLPDDALSAETFFTAGSLWTVLADLPAGGTGTATPAAAPDDRADPASTAWADDWDAAWGDV